MLCIQHHSTDPYFNIATDEFILKHLQEDCFMLWRNDNAIIVGRHQNTLAEINYDYVKAHNIHVVRRLSGGGAVYHDLGNINFSFTKKGDANQLIDFETYTRPIVEVLQNLGVNARFEGRNDITIDGRKISGNAEHVYRDKVLHHGTLLFSSKMKNVQEALRINPLKYKDKAVKSVAKRVTNISEHLPEPLSIESFTQLVMDHIISHNKDCVPYSFTKADLDKIEQIKQERYATRAWNYGTSPDYSFKKDVKTPGGHLEMNLQVEKGYIRGVKVYGDFFNSRDITEIEAALCGVEHEEQAIRSVLKQYTIGDYFHNMQEDDLIASMF